MNYSTEGACCVCGIEGMVDLHHIKTRASGGSDEEDNLLQLCRSHHIEIHTIGLVGLIKSYPDLESIVVNKGWRFDEFSNRWIRVIKE